MLPTSPTAESTVSARACVNARRLPRRWSTDPTVLVLDEPLNGADPVQRAHLIALFRRLGTEGRTVIVSSHVLNEVERLADRIIVIVHGRLAAAGGQRAIRDAMNDRPRHVLIRADDRRRLASALDGARRGGRHPRSTPTASWWRPVERPNWRRRCPPSPRDLSVRLREVRPLDDSLESLFRELVR